MNGSAQSPGKPLLAQFSRTLLLLMSLQAGAATAAERVTVTYGLLERSLPVQALDEYAQTGKASEGLRNYIANLDEQQEDQLRQLLLAKADLNVVTVSQFLYTEPGEILLKRLGEVIRTEANLSGFYAIRSALILAAAEPEGLTALNVLKQFPLSDLRIDLNRALQILNELQALIQQTQDAVALVQQESDREAATETATETATTLPNLLLPGQFDWQMSTFQLRDNRRNRQFPVDLYLPQRSEAAPIIVISHGLGSDRSTYAYLARQMASYGFVVAVPEHPGSNAQQLQALIDGTASQVTAPSEFVDRPLDIKYLLDELTRLNQTSELQGRFDLEHVGVVGQSFGGYTALALAGAQINFQQLAADCDRIGYNLSLLLQCRAQELSQPLPDLSDARVKAIIAINPIGSSLLGASDYAAIKIPVMLISGSADTVTPALIEQIRPFTWLSAERSLVLLQGGTHFSTINVPDSASELVSLPSEVVGPDPRLAQDYVKQLSIAFFETHVAANAAYRPYLSAAYVQQISQPLLPMALVQSLTDRQLSAILTPVAGQR
ncbi:MAG: alpha/beta hydrolase [Pegethrix bostrychoides GSE-TBD4-15B]|jgi:predicted dienelactone hydrolase|uniref:Alpha/beta hydrolase n=1 Tax=Pegethrix bostrychoides GSE-TBD4-15B TaxID=2839662 RepID=A0A951PC95_9CYAN|nr:alpha/beta hydrolase [Pegethrix bostrychoides GSE-TBD4-15B]